MQLSEKGQINAEKEQKYLKIWLGQNNRNLKFLKKNSIIAQFKAFNGRISEWAYSFNLDKQFQRYLDFVPKKGVFVDES